MAKRLLTGFSQLALAPVTENTLTSYKTGVGAALPNAGGMTRTAKESTTDLYYDDDLYAQIKDVKGEDVEIRLAEIDVNRLVELGLGTYDEATGVFEGEFNIAGKEFALRFAADTADGLPSYFNYRVFQLSGIKYDSHTTKKDSVTACEVIMTGVLKRPQLPGLAPWAMMQLKEDKSNLAACTAFLTAAETKPTA